MSPLRAALAGARRAWRKWAATWEGWWMRWREHLAVRWLPPELRRDAAADDRALAALRRQQAADADRRADLERRRLDLERRLAAVDLEIRIRRGGETDVAGGTR